MQKTREVYETAIRLARMWGVIQTLEEINEMEEFPTTDENVESIISWAEEYVESGQNDMFEFMKRKLQLYKKE